MTSKKKSLSIICPVMNEEKTIPLLLEEIEPHLKKCVSLMGKGATYEVLFVDDGSEDDTVEVINNAIKKNKKIKLLQFSRNFGKEAALAAALRHAKGDAVIPIDADLQDPPEMIVQMVEAWLDGAEVVNAKRANRDTDSFIKRFTASLFYKVYNFIAKNAIPENVGDFRLLDRVAVDEINKFTERNRFMKLIFSWVGYKQVTIEYVRAERSAGESKFNYIKLWNFALDGITGSTTLPLRMWTYIGILMSVITLVFATYIIIKTMIFGVEIPGYASLMVIILIFGSFNFISLGILGEYIGRIAEEVRNRPLYIIQEKIGFEEKAKAKPKAKK